MVTPALFKKFPDAESLAAARQEDVEDLVRSTGFFRNKAKNLIAAAKSLVREHHGEVPKDLETLTNLPGVGRKTANVVLGNAYGIEAGIVVDTHVARLSRRLGLTKQKDPVKIEKDLIKQIPQDAWTLWSHLLIWHGRRRCMARNPDCPNCELRTLCPTAR
jgi:endonuclease-3